MRAIAVELVVHHHRFHGPHLDYVGVGVGAFVSWLGLTGPGEAALIAAGLLAARGRVDLASVLLVAWAGAVAGGTAGWLVGLKGGRAVMTAPGPLHRTRARMLRSGDRFYTRFGALAVYLAPSWMAGINAMPARRFIPINALCCVAWTLLVGLGAYFAGPGIAGALDDIGTIGLVVLASAAAGGALVAALRARRRAAARKARES